MTVVIDREQVRRLGPHRLEIRRYSKGDPEIWNVQEKLLKRRDDRTAKMQWNDLYISVPWKVMTANYGDEVVGAVKCELWVPQDEIDEERPEKRKFINQDNKECCLIPYYGKELLPGYSFRKPIIKIALLEAFRRSEGIGSALVDAVKQEDKEGIILMPSSPEEMQYRLLEFYRHRGFIHDAVYLNSTGKPVNMVAFLK